MTKIEKLTKILNKPFPKESKITLKILPGLVSLKNGYNYGIGIYKNNKAIDAFYYPCDDADKLVEESGK